MQRFMNGGSAMVLGLMVIGGCEGSSLLNDVGNLDSNAGSGGSAGTGEPIGANEGGAVTEPLGKAGRGGGGEASNAGSGSGGSTAGSGGRMPGGGDAAKGGSSGNGASGSPEIPGPGGASGEPDSCGEPGECPFTVANDVRGLAADPSRLYWIEYGTQDEFQNYLGGKLRAQVFTASEADDIAEELERPVALYLAGGFAYLMLEPEGNGAPYRLARVPLTGGDLQIVNAGAVEAGMMWSFQPVVSSGAGDFYAYRGTIHRVAPGAEALSEVFLEGYRATQLAADETHLYFSHAHDENGRSDAQTIYRIPLEGGAPDAVLSVNDEAVRTAGFFPRAEQFYGFQIVHEGEDADDNPIYVGYLASAPNELGTSFTRFASFGRFTTAFSMVGERFYTFNLQYEADATQRFETGTLSAPSDTQVLARAAHLSSGKPWVGSSVGLFWVREDGNHIDFAPLPEE
jgi:hypothetical protein